MLLELVRALDGNGGFVTKDSPSRRTAGNHTRDLEKRASVTQALAFQRA
jgi:hypothetical protein